jgi:glucokinase
MSNAIVIGVDIGGSHITAGAIDIESQCLLKHTLKRNFVNANAGASEIIDLWSGTISAVMQTLGFNARIGIAMPGPFEYSSGISKMRNQNKFDALYGLNVGRLLADQLRISPNAIQFLNDATCFLRGEHFCGAAVNYQSVVGVTLGTGLGTSYLKEGRVEDADRWCSPFFDSIAEEYLSTRWFIKRYEELSGIQLNDVQEMANLHTKETLKVFTEFGQNLGLFLAQFCKSQDAELVVLGGNIANAEKLFLPETINFLSDNYKAVPIIKSHLGEEASLIGAASCWQAQIEFAVN